MKYIMAIDSGSTGIRAVVYDKLGKIVAKEYQKTTALLPKEGWIEHDPEDLWKALLGVVNRVFNSTDITPHDIAALGICNQRGSFVLWEKATGKPLSNFINWADIRSAETCESMNKSKMWRLLRKAAWVGRLLGNTMFTATTMLQFTTDHATVRLKWALDNIEGLRERCDRKEVQFGTIDSWFIYRLTGGKVHATDYSNAATGLLNPFDLVWNPYILRIFKIPKHILPDLRETISDYGSTEPSLFDSASIPIRAVAGDQQAALFGQCCFEPGDVKISQGSGAFVDMVVGDTGKVSKRGLFPLIAWVINGKPMYMLEGYVATAGTLIDWLGGGIGLSDTPAILNEFAAKCEDTEGVIFIPTPSGIRFPYFSPQSRASIIGLSLNTHRSHVARAVFEGIAMRLVDILEGLEKDTKIPIRSLKTDGGVSQSDILLQCIADFANLDVLRASEADMTATGIAFLAGLGANFWKDQEELIHIYFNTNPDTFKPKLSQENRAIKRKKWITALNAILRIK
ncbi:MAG: glycerol kinase 5 [Candidatus Hodarchaeales archaeon]|jgi:glycerol kinase